jgi:hypothetical protein
MVDKATHSPETNRPKRGGDRNAERMRLTINHGMAIERFRKQVDLQLTELAVGIAEIKNLLKSRKPA